MRYAVAAMLFLIPSAAFAASSSVDQSRITIQGVAGAVVSSRLRVTNTDTTEQQYELSAPEQLTGRVSMNPAAFTLGPGQSQDVVLRFRMPANSQKTHLEVRSFDSRERGLFKVASGIRLPLLLIASHVAGATAAAASPDEPLPVSNPWTFAVYAIDGALFIVAGCLVYCRRLVININRGRNYKISFI